MVNWNWKTFLFTGLFLFLAILVIGLPIVIFQKWLILATLIILITASQLKSSLKCLALGTGVLLLTILLRMILPFYTIEEGHNTFLIWEDRDPFKDELPQPIYEKYRNAFHELFPPVEDASFGKTGSWKPYGIPIETYAFSSDSFWQDAKYSRQTRKIEFSYLGGQKFGFVNDRRYAFYDHISEIPRDRMPYFLMWEINNALIGSELIYYGPFVWELEDGSIEEWNGQGRNSYIIDQEDVGKRLWVAKFDASEWKPVFLIKSQSLVFLDYLHLIVSITGILIAYILCYQISVKRFIIYFQLAAIAFVLFSHKYEIFTYEHPPLWGGSDGLFHEGLGYQITKDLANGNIYEALQGGEKIFFYVPFYRFYRSIEDIFFGDTNYLVVLTMVMMPLAFFYFLRQFIIPSYALIITLIFLMNPWYLSYARYMEYAAWGLAEPMAFTYLMLALGMLFDAYKNIDKESNYLNLLTLGFFLLGIVVFFRPNYLIIAGLLLLYTIFKLWQSSSKPGILIVISAFAIPMSMMPLHNYIYGNEFVLLTRSVGVNTLVSPSIYIEAAVSILKLDLDNPSISLISSHLKEWITSIPISPFQREFWESLYLPNLVLKISIISITLLTLFIRKIDLGIKIIALATILSHLTLFVLKPSGRFALIFWEIALIISLIVLINYSKYIWLNKRKYDSNNNLSR